MQKWKRFPVFIYGLLTVLFIPEALAQSPAGNWISLDDKTGQKRAIIRLTVAGDSLTGTLEKIFPQPGDIENCEKCPGEFKDKPIRGLQFIWGLKDKGNGEWGGGRILDPKTGSIYRAKMTLKDDKLYVKGYLGVSIIGRTQVWIR